MTNLQQAMVSLQDDFWEELETARVKDQRKNDNQLIKEHLQERKVKEEIKEGYLKMGPINLKLASENFKLENKTFFNYEARLAECD